MKNNPFDIFTKQEETIKVDALGGAEVTIKTALTVAEQLRHDELMYANMGVNKEGRPFFNPADTAKAQVFTVSAILVNPKMSIVELNKISGADEAISEIYNKYITLKDKKQKLIEGN